MKIDLSYIVFSLFLISAIGCTGSKNVLLEGGAYSEELQRDYFQGAQHLLKGDQEAAYASSSATPPLGRTHIDCSVAPGDTCKVYTNTGDEVLSATVKKE